MSDLTLWALIERVRAHMRILRMTARIHQSQPTGKHWTWWAKADSETRAARGRLDTYIRHLTA